MDAVTNALFNETQRVKREASAAEAEASAAEAHAARCEREAWEAEKLARELIRRMDQAMCSVKLRSLMVVPVDPVQGQPFQLK